MSHATGTFISLGGSPVGIGPAFGAPNNINFPHTAPPAGEGPTKFIILHFQNASFPGMSRLEVNLGYTSGEIDIFTSADGTDFWTRPINVSVLPGGNIPISFIPDGAGGGVQITGYARGQRHEEDVPGGSHDSFSNSDPFLTTGNYTEPDYDPFWLCHSPPHWENVATLPDADIRRKVSHSVGMLVSVHGTHVSTCSCTLIGDDLVISAAHCIDAESDIASMSVIFNYETKPGGQAPDSYSPVFHKIIQVVNHGPLGISSTIDYMLLRVKTPAGGLGLPTIPMRATRPPLGEQVFGIHHPNGAVKKVSPWQADGFAVVTSSTTTGHIKTQFDVSGGTSGSGLFDMAGRFCGVLSSGQGGPFAFKPADRNPECEIGYASSAEILNHLTGSLPASVARDVVLVFDKSGSMSEITDTGLTKLQEAKNAASLFIQLIRAGGTDQVGLVTFSSSAVAVFDLADVNAGNKTTLIGPAPFNGGTVGGILAGGTTSIGAGLATAREQMNLHGLGTNKRTVFLLTDGLQNTLPTAESASATLINTDVFAVGYGTEAGLNGDLLTQIAQSHNGIYLRAGDGLSLMKFFALTFGNIFEAGTLLDPDYLLPAAKDQADPIPFRVCEETAVTVVLGWDKIAEPLNFRVQLPSGAFITLPAHGITMSRGQNWLFARIDLPYNGEQNGTWKVYVDRIKGGGEFPNPSTDVRYFVNILAKDGPVVVLKTYRDYYYTGDDYNPMVAIATKKGYRAPNGRVKLYITKPKDGTGNLLSQKPYENVAGTIDGDDIPARFNALKKMERELKGKPLIAYAEEVVELLDIGSPADGAMEPDGIFGLNLKDLFRHEGHYTFRAVAEWGDGCTGSREINWSVNVFPGIDHSRSEIGTRLVSTLPDGKQRIRITITPRDKYGNMVGPGRTDAIQLTPATGSVIVSGAVKDEGNGSYGVTVVHDPASGNAPGVIISQPGRPPVSVMPVMKPKRSWKWCYWVIAFLLLLIAALLVLLARD
jgi:hypothetical protein